MEMDNIESDYGLGVELRAGTLSPDLVEVSEILNLPIFKEEMWLTYNGEGKYVTCEIKYGDYYPQFGLLVKTAKADGNEPLVTIEKPMDDSFSSDNSTGWIGRAIDALIDTKDDTTMDYQIHLNTSIIPDFLNQIIKERFPEGLTVSNNGFNFKLKKHAFNYLTSAKYHKRIGSLYAVNMVDRGYSAYKSFFRSDELFRAFVPKGSTTFANVGNFALVTDSYVIYLHMDDLSFKSHNLQQMNRYRYNDSKNGELPVYDCNNGMALIPYNNWVERIADKPILMFCWNEVMLAHEKKSKLLNFNGEFNLSDRDIVGNYKLVLADYRYDFLSPFE